MKRTPLIILNGFLGAGKTTLLKNLLTQAHKRRMTVSVIVNDMSELDVDGVLIANTEIVDAASNNFVSISADSISSRSGIQKLDSALKNLLETRSPDFILLETSGSSHPLPLVRYLREHTQVSLKAFLSLVDTVMLNDDYDGGKKLIPETITVLFAKPLNLPWRWANGTKKTIRWTRQMRWKRCMKLPRICRRGQTW